MTEPNESQAAILRQHDWRQTYGLWYKRRVCHHPTGQFEMTWVSPNAARYHDHCVLESPQVKRLLKKAERSEA